MTMNADDMRVIKAVFNILYKYPDGVSLNRLAKLSGIPNATLRWHLNRGDLAHYVEDTAIGPENRPFVRLIRLKPSVLSKRGQKLARILSEYE